MLFDLENAKKSLNKYKKKGTRKPTRILLDSLINQNIHGLTLLDIGGGFGPIPQELFPKGLKFATNIDASHGYIEVSKQFAEEKNTISKSKFQFGDFIDEAANIENHDIVTLDKVICCYPEAFELIKLSTEKCNKYYGLVFPWGGIFAKIGTKVINFILGTIKGNPFKTYIHNPEQVYAFIEKQGFKTISHTSKFPWNIVLYERIKN